MRIPIKLSDVRVNDLLVQNDRKADVADYRKIFCHVGFFNCHGPAQQVLHQTGRRQGTIQ